MALVLEYVKLNRNGSCWRHVQSTIDLYPNARKRWILYHGMWEADPDPGMPTSVESWSGSWHATNICWELIRILACQHLLRADPDPGMATSAESWSGSWHANICWELIRILACQHLLGADPDPGMPASAESWSGFWHATNICWELIRILACQANICWELIRILACQHLVRADPDPGMPTSAESLSWWRECQHLLRAYPDPGMPTSAESWSGWREMPEGRRWEFLGLFRAAGGQPGVTARYF